MRRTRETSACSSGGEFGRFSAACSRVSHQMSSDRIPHPRPRPFGVTLGGVHAYTSTPRNAHREPSRRFLATDVPRQPTGQPGPRSGFTASHYGSVETRVYQRREGLHVFIGAIHSEQSTDSDVLTIVAVAISVLIVDWLVQRRRVQCIAVALRTLVSFVYYPRNIQSVEDPRTCESASC